MTEEKEIEALNASIRSTSQELGTDYRSQRRAAMLAREEAEAHRAHQMHCVWLIGWTAFGWITAFGVSVILMHIGKICLDTGASIIAGVSAVAGILVGRLISKMGE